MDDARRLVVMWAVARLRGRHAERASRAIGLACALVLWTAAAPAPATAFEKAFWGPTQVNGMSQFPRYEALDVTLYQIQLAWNTTASRRPARPSDPADPAYRWPPEIDYAIKQAQRHGMSVLVMIIGAPRWAGGGTFATRAPPPRDFARFARAASRRYRQVHRWMIWGEPSRIPNFRPQTRQPYGARLTARQARTPRRYARILDAAYGQLKARSRSNIVIGGNTYTNGDTRPVDWVKNMKLEDGRPPRMDEYGHNPFSLREPDLANPPSRDGVVDFSDLRSFSTLVQRRLGRPRHRRVKLFLSEYTIPTDAPDKEFNYFVPRATQAKWISSAFRVARGLRSVTGLGWIHLYDDPPKPGGGLVVHGGLLTHDGQEKPGYRAFANG